MKEYWKIIVMLGVCVGLFSLMTGPGLAIYTPNSEDQIEQSQVLTEESKLDIGIIPCHTVMQCYYSL